MQTIQLLQNTRNLMKHIIEGLSETQLTRIPDGYNNHLFWHLGHVTVTQQLLHYRLSELPMYVEEDMVNLFRGGTSPKEWTAQPDMDMVLSLLTDLPEKLIQDYNAGRFQTYQGMTTRTGFELKTFEDAVDFNIYHEGIHTGYMMAMRRLVV